jgi:hypothetical protein
MTDDTRAPITATPGDVLFSSYRLPVPDAILHDSKRRRGHVEVSRRALQGLFEFLEYVVLNERLIIPVAAHSALTERIMNDELLDVEFSAYRLPGRFPLRQEDIVARLEESGVLFYARLDAGSGDCESLVNHLLPTSRALQAHLRTFAREAPPHPVFDKKTIGDALLAVRCGEPLHIAEVAGLGRMPFVYGGLDAAYMRSFERETLRQRRSARMILLDRLNGGARREVERLSNLGGATAFPETPIASMLLREAKDVSDTIEVAIQLRSEFAAFRQQMNELESELVNDDLPLKRRLRKLEHLKGLVSELWPRERTALSTSAVELAAAAAAIPEFAAMPSPSGGAMLLQRMTTVPLESLLRYYRRRRIRLLLKAKRTFLKSHSSAETIGRLVGVPAALVRESWANP